MANAIALFKKYIDLLDDVYKAASCSSVLDMDGSLVQAGANANEIIIPKISMDGLADYSRNGGYVQGNVEITNETVKFNYDRGRKFSVDAMDNEETAGLASASLQANLSAPRLSPKWTLCALPLTLPLTESVQRPRPSAVPRRSWIPFVRA